MTDDMIRYRLSDFGQLPKVSPRELATRKADHELLSFMIGLRERHGLTIAEEVYLLSERLRQVGMGAVAIERRNRK